jgi:hypothetical protein
VTRREQPTDRVPLARLLSMRTESVSEQRTRGGSRRRKTTRTRSRCTRARHVVLRACPRSHHPATGRVAGAACVPQRPDGRLRARKFRAHRCSCARILRPARSVSDAQKCCFYREIQRCGAMQPQRALFSADVDLLQESIGASLLDTSFQVTWRPRIGATAWRAVLPTGTSRTPQ